MDERRHCNIPETPFGARLRAARKMAGLSMEDLAAKLDGLVTKQAISKYEQGLMMPSPEVLEKLVAALKIATWGASPLKPADQELEAARLKESPALFPVGAEERPLFRRARFLSRTCRKAETQPEPETLPLGSAKGMHAIFSIHANEIPQGERIRPAGVRDSTALRGLPQSPPHADHGEAIESPSLRRDRYLRDWDFADAVAAPLEKIRFRAGERLASKTEAALRYRIADHLQKYLELEAILGQPAPFENPLGPLAPRSSEEVEAAAARVREVWELGVGPIVNLLGLLEDKGIKIYETRGIEGFEGLSGRFGDVVFVAVSMDRPADRVRFTAAHELGHVLCDFGAAEDPEGECHAFGAAFLLPRPALEKVFSPARRKVTLGDLAEIKETYGVSLQAIMHRAHRLGFVTDRQFRSFRETLKDKDWMVTEPVAYEGKERASRFRRLLHYAVAAAILDIGRAAELLGTTPEALNEEIGDIF
jgi:Zn-dependent peptidase ImmA (M78 family)/transcriptional regulator with XRE-family HTH domain